MNYRKLGNSGLFVSELCYGAMSFTGSKGWSHISKTNQKEADELTAMAIDNGINFIDTADIYSEGASEIMLGKALGKKRKDIILTTKFGFKVGEGTNDNGLSRKRVIEACDASLKRLNTDYIDLYLIHAADFVTPLEETLSALNDLVRQGKVRYIGCSNFYGWQLVKANSISEKNGWEKLIVNQIYYSLLGREAEYEMIPAAIEEGIANTIWSPLHGGILSGKYFDKKNWPKDTRIKEPGAHFPYDVVQGEEVMKTVIRIAKDNKVSPAQVSLNYLLKKKGVTSLVIGAKNKEQLLDNLNTVKWELTKEQFDELDNLSAPKNVYPHWYYNFFRKAELEKGSHL